MIFCQNNYILDLSKSFININEKELIMNKKFALLIAFALMLGSVCVFAADGSQRSGEQETKTSTLDKKTVYYPNASLRSAISKYKAGNYSGCLQELFSLVKKEPSNAAAYYYMAMAYAHVDMKSDAVEAYEKVMALKPNSYLADFAEKGRDCLTEGPKCKPADADGEQSDLDKFINAPYGNGLSPELNGEVRQKELNNIKETINKKEDLERRDIRKIRDFDTRGDYQSYAEETVKIAMVSDEEILQAVKTLKDAGLNLTVQQDSSYSQYQDPRMSEMSMLLGNNNSNNMMNALPMLMTKAQNGENVDPRFMQAIMMNSMMSDLDFNGSNNNRY